LELKRKMPSSVPPFVPKFLENNRGNERNRDEARMQSSRWRAVKVTNHDYSLASGSLQAPPRLGVDLNRPWH
jgi:hypothetical protein